MIPNKHADEEVAATDAVFEELAVHTDPGTDSVEPATPDTSAGTAVEGDQPPVGDYVRELQEEFERQEDEATL